MKSIKRSHVKGIKESIRRNGSLKGLKMSR